LTGANPTDRGKSGTKRHVLTDQKGIPLSVSITGANTHDMKATIVQRPHYKQNLCLDKGYDFPERKRNHQGDTFHIYVIEAKNGL
jgi:putative transposase